MAQGQTQNQARRLFTRVRPQVGLALLILLFALAACGETATQPGIVSPEVGMPESRPAPQLWQIQGGGFSMEAHTSEGEFKVKQILFSPASIRFFYSMKLNLSSNGNSQALPVPGVTATSTVPACYGKILPSIPLTVQVQSLGKLGDFEIGVIHITDWKNRPGQLISLKVQPPTVVNTNNNKNPVWDLPALQQLNPISPATTGGMFLSDTAGSPNVAFNGPSGLNFDRQAGFIWLDDVTRTVYSPPLIFIEIDQADKVTLVSQQEYVDIAGPLPQIYNRTDQYPATPTLPGYTPPPTLKTPCQ